MGSIFSPQQIVNGLQLGAIYALIALGYTMVYGIVRLINFAHGDFFMVGAYAAFGSFFMFNFFLPPGNGLAFIVLILPWPPVAPSPSSPIISPTSHSATSRSSPPW